jgi:hypothetical protein
VLRRPSLQDETARGSDKEREGETFWCGPSSKRSRTPV